MTKLINWIKAQFARIPSLWRTAVVTFIVVFLLAFLWFYGMKAWNGIGNWMYHHSENDAKAEINQIKTEALDSKKIAEEAVNAFKAEKQLYEEEKKQHDIAKQILADASKNTSQKLAAYEAAVNARPTVTGPQSTDELCARAAALGIANPCQ